jgi:hypothetical protein
MLNKIGWVGLVALALAPLPAVAQTSGAAAPAASSGAIPSRTSGPSGPHSARSRHRNTLTRQQARFTAEHARRHGATPIR